MRASVLLLSCAGAALANEGFLKLDVGHAERAPRLRKRQANTADLGQTINAVLSGSVRSHLRIIAEFAWLVQTRTNFDRHTSST